MGEVINPADATAPKVTTDEYFGGCPHCGNSDVCRTIGRDHWMCCETHKTKWWVGSNLFSIPDDIPLDEWAEMSRTNEYLLSNYLTVEPIHRVPTEEEIAEREKHVRDALWRARRSSANEAHRPFKMPLVRRRRKPSLAGVPGLRRSPAQPKGFGPQGS